MKSQLRALAVAAVMLGHSAMAADYPIYPVNAPLYRPPVRNQLFTWTSCYVGANLGGKWGNTSVGATGPFIFAPDAQTPVNRDQSVGSFLGGGQLGCNLQIGTWVLGIEGDIDAQHLDTSRNIGVLFAPVGPALPQFIPISSVDFLSRWQASVRGRIGYAWDRILVYATGGVAWSDMRLTTQLPGASVGPETLVGGTVGGGVEHAFLATNWSVAVEGRYTTYGTHSFNSGNPPSSVNVLGFTVPLASGPVISTFKFYIVEGLIKLNYRFGAPAY